MGECLPNQPSVSSMGVDSLRACRDLVFDSVDIRLCRDGPRKTGKAGGRSRHTSCAIDVSWLITSVRALADIMV